jgi:hypothetical protein
LKRRGSLKDCDSQTTPNYYWHTWGFTVTHVSVEKREKKKSSPYLLISFIYTSSKDREEEKKD